MKGVNRLALYSWGQDPDFRPSCRLQTSDQVRSLRDNTIVQSAFKALYTVQPNIAIPLYNPNACHCTAIMASRYIQPAIVALASYNLVQSALNVSPLYNKVWLSIVQRWGKPYSEHVLAAPGYEARSDLTHTSMQYVPGYGARAASSV